MQKNSFSDLHYALATDKLTAACNYCSVTDSELLIKISKEGWSFQSYNAAVTIVANYFIEASQFSQYTVCNAWFKIKLLKDLLEGPIVEIIINPTIGEVTNYSFQFLEQSQKFEVEYRFLGEGSTTPEEWLTLSTLKPTRKIIFDSSPLLKTVTKLLAIDVNLEIILNGSNVAEITCSSPIKGVKLQRYLPVHSDNPNMTEILSFKCNSTIKEILKTIDKSPFVIEFEQTMEYLVVYQYDKAVTAPVRYVLVALER